MKLRYLVTVFKLLVCFGALTTSFVSLANEQSRAMCIKKAGGLIDEGVCNQREIKNTHDKVRQLTASIEKELTNCTPAAEAYDYKKALANLKKSSQDWKLFLQHDCELTANLVGPGTGVTSANQLCQLNHLRLRVKALSTRLKSIESTRIALTENNAMGNNPNGFITCKQQ